MDDRSSQTDQTLRRNRITVSAIVATYNEERHIGECLQGLLAQRGFDGDLEIIVVDGMSPDRTRDIVRSFPEYGTRIRLEENRRRLQVYAWNIGLRAARGEYVVMIGAHAEYSTNYIATCLEVMQRTGAAAVGGVQVPYGEGPLGNAIAWCMSSAFGMGNARFRYTDREEETDSVFGLFTRLQTIQNAGGFDERVPFDEDAELNYRIRSNGGKLIVSPAIGIRYHVRRSLSALSKQMYRYGFWRRLTQMMHPERTPLRTYAPAALIAALFFSIALANTALRVLPWAVTAAYVAFILVAALKAAPRIGAAALLVPVALVTMHVSYGVGWWMGLLTLRSVPQRST